jgi:transcriptional regulator with XRE-family HTH domain
MVAENIRRLRAMRVMTYVALSRRLAVIGRPIPVLGLRRIEQGERRVDADDLVALAEVLGVEPVQLLAAPACNACYGAPAYGFTCNECGASAGEQR